MTGYIQSLYLLIFAQQTFTLVYWVLSSVINIYQAIYIYKWSSLSIAYLIYFFVISLKQVSMDYDPPLKQCGYCSFQPLFVSVLTLHWQEFNYHLGQNVLIVPTWKVIEQSNISVVFKMWLMSLHLVHAFNNSCFLCRSSACCRNWFFIVDKYKKPSPLHPLFKAENVPNLRAVLWNYMIACQNLAG